MRVRMILTLAVLLHGAATVAMPAALQAQTALPVVTLDEARERAAEVDPAAVAARGGIDTAEWERRAAWSDLFTPTVTASTSFARYSDPFFNFGTGEITANATNAFLEAQYTVFGGGKRAGLQRAGAAVESAEATARAASFRTTLLTDAAYYAVLADVELARVAAERLRRANESLALARVRVQAGETIATDSLQLLLAANSARLAVLQRDSALAVSRLRLGHTIGLSGAADAAPIDAGTPPALPLTLEQAIAELRGSGPELIAARAAERSADAALSVERWQYLPDVIVSGTTGAYDSEFFPSALRRSQVAVMVAWPLWNAGQRELSHARARAQHDVARAESEARERAAAVEMAQAYNGYETARASVELAQMAVSLSAETYRVQTARYREGATTILDLLEAQVALGEAEAGLVQARYGALLGLARIEALLGRRLFEETN